MSGDKFKVPKTWAQLRAIGLVLQSQKDGEEEITPEDPSPLLASASTFVSSKIGDRDQVTALKNAVETATKTLGPAGLLALCNLSNRINPKTCTDTDIMALYLHAIILSTDKYNVKVKCVGATEDDNDDFDSELQWPEIIPPNWNQAPGNYSFRYNFSYRKPGEFIRQ